MRQATSSPKGWLRTICLPFVGLCLLAISWSFGGCTAPQHGLMAQQCTADI